MRKRKALTQEGKARSLSAGLKHFPGPRGARVSYVLALLRLQVPGPCVYCGQTITLRTASLDHKTAFGSREARQDSALQKKLNVPENLQIICRRCNSAKSDFSHAQFEALLASCETPEIKQRLLFRLRMGGAAFRRAA